MNQQTATEVDPLSTFWTKNVLRSHTALPGASVRRPTTRKLAHGGDPVRLAAVFGIDAKTAIRYATTARRLLESNPERHTSE
ncbi:hypothetical protein ACQEUX_12715 [Micromonospora sp. CA-259024]|uniref:hypothetical protein n=1 Tax=Micromonospora sp. CA-259024 TaxID=3239965 RepID=UPI003D91083F